MIEVRQLSKAFGGQTVLDRIDLDVAAGEVVAIIGPSGSGKTTLLRCLNLLEEPDAGSIRVGEIRIEAGAGGRHHRELVRRLRQQVGFVFQNFNLIPRTNALKNVELPMLYAGIPARQRTERAKELLAMVEMEDRMYHQPNELSGGQKQRVAIARAMANDPAILLADEPTGALDSKTGRLVMDLFHTLNRDHGKTIVLITHNPALAKETSRVLTMRDGLLYNENAEVGA